MKRVRMWGIAVALLIAAAAFASPIYGTWTGEIDGKPISLTFTRAQNQTQGNLVFTSQSQAGIPVADFRMVKKGTAGLYPLLFSFRTTGESGKSVRYEMEQTSATEATLRNVDDPGAPTVKLAKTK